MNVVIYTVEMEPITIIDLPISLLRKAYEWGTVRVAVEIPFAICSKNEPDNPWLVETPIVDLKFERLITRFNGHPIESWIVTTRNEEWAMALKPSWLPGQQKIVNKYEQNIKILNELLVVSLRGMFGE